MNSCDTKVLADSCSPSAFATQSEGRRADLRSTCCRIEGHVRIFKIWISILVFCIRLLCDFFFPFFREQVLDISGWNMTCSDLPLTELTPPAPVPGNNCMLSFISSNVSDLIKYRLVYAYWLLDIFSTVTIDMSDNSVRSLSRVLKKLSKKKCTFRSDIVAICLHKNRWDLVTVHWNYWIEYVGLRKDEWKVFH